MTALPEIPPGAIGVYSPRGTFTVLHYRESTSDLSTIGSTFRLWGKLDDEYGLADLFLGAGDTFVDIGAHVGTVAIAALVDNPEAQAIAVEPLAENVDIIARSAESAGVASRLRILHAAIAPGQKTDIGYDFDGDDYLHNHRFIGGMMSGQSTARQHATVPTVTVAALVKMAGGHIAAMKFDCEGCEWHALKSPAMRHVGLIVGEWHDWAIDYQDSVARLSTLLAKTHDVSVVNDMVGTGIFRAVPR